jgi:hypothetical protein
MAQFQSQANAAAMTGFDGQHALDARGDRFQLPGSVERATALAT